MNADQRGIECPTSSPLPVLRGRVRVGARLASLRQKTLTPALSRSTGRGRKFHASRRGFAMLTAIALVALVAVAMAAAASVFRLDLRRTVTGAEDAQLRQLLFAGERIARAKLPREDGKVESAAGPVQLPPALAAQGASMNVGVAPKADNADAAVATVEATLGGRAAAQTLRYERGPGGWRLAGVEITDSSASLGGN